MKVSPSITYYTDAGRTLLVVDGKTASVKIYQCTADELDELSWACQTAAAELRAIAASEPVRAK